MSENNIQRQDSPEKRNRKEHRRFPKHIFPSATNWSLTLNRKSMNLPEDRHPLLYVYLDDDQPERVRSRCVTQGASTLLGKWPEHLTFSWMMAVTGLVSLLACFLLAVVFLMASSSAHNQTKRALMAKCERNEHVVQLVHMKNLEDLTVNENATYFVEIITNTTENANTACSLESYLKRTSHPVFLVSITSNESLLNQTFSDELERKFRNFKTITFDLNSFFNKTVFANFQNQNAKFLTFLAKVLVSWNVGGTVIDTNVKTLKDFHDRSDRTLTIGRIGDDVVLISAKRFCHAYIFDVLKTITETRDILDYSDLDIIKAALKRFCHARWTPVAVAAEPVFCNSTTANENCTYFLQKPRESLPGNFSWDSLCPLTKALI